MNSTISAFVLPSRPIQPTWAVLPDDLLSEISTYLTPEEVGRASGICRSWQAAFSDPHVWRQQARNVNVIPRGNEVANPKQVFANPYPVVAFGRDEWIRHVGDPGEVPRLPSHIHEILRSPCPFWPNSTVGQTHALVLIPRSVTRRVDGVQVTVPLTLRNLNRLARSGNEGAGIGYRYIGNEILAEHGDTEIESHWVLMTKDVLPGNRNRNFEEQRTLIANHAGYTVPKGLDVAAVVLMQYLRSGERLLGDDRRAYTQCQERARGYRLVVGGFAPGGLFVHTPCFDYDYIGVAGLRKF